MLKHKLTESHEKRYSTRLWIHQPIDFTVGMEQEKHSGELINLSTGGLSFQTSEKVKLYDKIRLTFKQTGITQRFSLRVLRVTPTKSQQYLIACKIKQLIH